MPTPLLIGAGSGLVSAALFASAATATALAGVLFYLAPLAALPRRARLGRHGRARLGARPAPFVIAVSLGPATAAIFALSIGAPTCGALAHLALLSRPVATPQGQVAQARSNGIRPDGSSVGRAMIAGALAAILVLILGYDQESYAESIRQMLDHSALKELDRDGTLFTEETIASMAAMIARALPAAFAIVWLTITLVQSLDGRTDRGCIGARAQALARPRTRSSCRMRFVLDLRRAHCSHLSCRACRACLPPGFAGALLFAYRAAGASGDPRL